MLEHHRQSLPAEAILAPILKNVSQGICRVTPLESTYDDTLHARGTVAERLQIIMEREELTVRRLLHSEDHSRRCGTHITVPRVFLDKDLRLNVRGEVTTIVYPTMRFRPLDRAPGPAAVAGLDRSSHYHCTSYSPKKKRVDPFLA